MYPLLQALIAPRIAAVTAVARLTLRRAVLTTAAAFFAIGALVFLSVGIVVALMPAVGAAWALVIMAAVWALVALICLLLARVRARILPVPAPAPAISRPAPPRPADGGAPPATDRIRAGVKRAAPVLAIGALIAGLIAGRR